MSFDFTGDAGAEVARFFKQMGKVIVVLTARQILDEPIAHRHHGLRSFACSR